MKTRSKIALFALLSIAIIVLALYCICGITTRRINDPESKGVSTYYYLGDLLIYKSFEKGPVKKRVKVTVKTDPDIDAIIKKTRGLFLRDQIERFEHAFATDEFDKCCYDTGIMNYAAYLGDLDRVKKLDLDLHKQSLYHQHTGYNNALFYAARGGHLEIVQWLVEKGGNINAAKYHLSMNVLFFAAESGNIELVKWLIEHGAVTKLEDHSHETRNVILYAAKSGNWKLVQWLNENGEDIKADINGETVLHYAAESGELELVKWLVEKKKLKINALSKSGKRPIWFAAKSGNLELIRWFVHHESKFNLDILPEAAKSGNQKLVRWIIEKANSDPIHYIASMDTVTKKQKILNTALLYAAKHGSLETVQYLLKVGASINANESIWESLTDNHCYWCSDFIRYRDLLSCAVDGNNHVLVEWIIDQGVDINSSSALTEAIFNQDYLMVKHLVKKGANVNAFPNGGIPLAFAIRRVCYIGSNDMRIIDCLIEHGAITDVGNGSSDPVYAPASSGNLEMVKYLIQHKASGSRALAYAKKSYNENLTSDDFESVLDQRLQQTIKWLEDQGFQPEAISNE
ncbi:MAG: ankyrin repeat domain-containing protein [Thermoguttaceae bacterium]|nr:ankyrin repeat domain-containing protein [Thermoguttaceae bacterium]